MDVAYQEKVKKKKTFECVIQRNIYVLALNLLKHFLAFHIILIIKKKNGVKGKKHNISFNKHKFWETIQANKWKSDKAY